MGGLWSYITQEVANAECREAKLDDISTFNIILGISLAVISGFSILPSLIKPLRAKSTVGLSPWTLLLTNYQQTAQVLNIIPLKSQQMKLCANGFLACQPTMLTLWQSGSAWFLLFWVFIAVVIYPNPNDEKTKRRNRLLWGLQLVTCMGAVIIVSIISLTSDCPQGVAAMGQTFGFIASGLMFLRFAPQLLTSCCIRTAGQISYVTYVVIGMGGFLLTYFQIFAAKEHLSTWLPVLVGNVFQTFIVMTCAFYDFGPGKRYRGKPCFKSWEQQPDDVELMNVREA